MELLAKEQAMLAGDLGAGVRKAMEIVCALGQIYGARRLVPVGSVQVAGVSYRNLGEAGLEFLREWAGQSAKARVPTTLNPAGMDLRAWQALGFSESFARSQLAVIDAFRRKMQILQGADIASVSCGRALYVAADSSSVCSLWDQL